MTQISEINPKYIEDLILIKNKIKIEKETILSFQKKYDENPEQTRRILGLLNNSIDSFVSKQFFDYDHLMFEDFILTTKNRIYRIESMALIEIAYRILIEINYSINSIFYFKDLRKRVRTSELELKEIEDQLDKISIDDDIEKINLKLKTIIVELQNVNLELFDENRVKSKSFLSTAVVWPLPLLIGVYQLIANQYFKMSPLYPIIVYVVGLVFVYLFLKIPNPKYFWKHTFNAIKDVKNMIYGGLILTLLIGVFEHPDYELSLTLAMVILVFVGIVFISQLMISRNTARSDYMTQNLKIINVKIREKIYRSDE